MPLLKKVEIFKTMGRFDNTPQKMMQSDPNPHFISKY